MSMMLSGIQGQLLEVTVVRCSKLKDTEWISRQDPYVCLEYGSTKFRTRTCKDGGKNPTFQEKFVFNLIEGLREINIAVWNRNTVSFDDFIGGGKVQLHKVLSQGFDDGPWVLQTKTGRFAGEAWLILHYANAKKPGMTSDPSAPPFYSQAAASLYSTQQPPVASPYGPPPPTAYSAPPYSAYPPSTAAYPPPTAYIHSAPSAYPLPPAYPPQSAYPPPPYQPPHGAPYCPQGPFPGLYPPPPY